MIWYLSHKPYIVLSCQEQLIRFVIGLEESSSFFGRKHHFRVLLYFSLTPHPFYTHIEKENICILLNQILVTVIRLPLVKVNGILALFLYFGAKYLTLLCFARHDIFGYWNIRDGLSLKQEKYMYGRRIWITVQYNFKIIFITFILGSLSVSKRKKENKKWHNTQCFIIYLHCIPSMITNALFVGMKNFLGKGGPT